jgi:hypothetical protein
MAHGAWRMAHGTWRNPSKQPQLQTDALNSAATEIRV